MGRLIQLFQAENNDQQYLVSYYIIRCVINSTITSSYLSIFRLSMLLVSTLVVVVLLGFHTPYQLWFSWRINWSLATRTTEKK